MIKQMDMQLENGGKYLFLKVRSEAEVAGNQLVFLESSHFFGLLPMTVIEKESNVYFRYDLSSWENIRSLFLKGLSKERLFKLLLNITETLIHAEKIGLSFENIVVDKQHIYIDPLSGRPLFIYLPLKTNRYEQSPLKEFLLNIMWMAPYDEQDDLLFYMKIHNYLVLKEKLDLAEFMQKLQEFASSTNTNQAVAPLEALKDTRKGIGFYSPGHSEMYEGAKDPGEPAETNRKNKAGQRFEIEEEVQYKRITRTELGEKKSLLATALSLGGASINIKPNLGSNSSIEMEDDSEGTTVLGAFTEIDENGTTALGAGNSLDAKPFLLTAAGNKRILITKAVFKIGRDPRISDYTTDNKVVGRIHAQIITENGEYFLEDQRSTNGSFVNDIKLARNEKVKIKHNDRIRLANEEFVFKLF